jgi:phosphomannomutase
VPTPAVACCIKERGLAGGIMITASHNPPHYNGIKFIPAYAGPASSEITTTIEGLIPTEDNLRLESLPRDFPDLIEVFPCGPIYRQYLYETMATINTRTRMKLVVDPMYGSGQGYLEEILHSLGHQVVTIHQGREANFGGLLPEPKASNLAELATAVRANRAELGIALDGDADRFGLIGPRGEYISPNQVYGLVASYILDRTEGSACFARTMATSHIIDRVAQGAGGRVIETPVGFKYLAQTIIEQGAQLGAEESGGLCVNPNIPEKDGIVAGLSLMRILSEGGVGLAADLAQIESKYGRLISKRVPLLRQ